MYEDFYRTGIKKIKFKSEKLDKVLKEIYEGKIREGYFLKTKYPKTYDMRPDVISYDKVFLEVLNDNNILNIIRSETLRDLKLSHIQVRVVEDENSYMNWHRDTYYNNVGNLIGQAPSGIKIIYYPDFTNTKSDRLLYLKGSNRIIFPSNAYDSQLFNILKVEKISSSNEEAILFDTSGLHAVVPETPGKKSIRLIYSFLEKEQIDAISSDPENIHKKTMSLYDINVNVS